VLVSLPVAFVAISLVFFAFKLIPGNPARVFLGPQASAGAVARLSRQLGLDRPIWVQYTKYVGNLAQGHFGTSITTGQPVLGLITSRLYATLGLVVFAFILSVVVGMGLGVMAGSHYGGVWDHICSFIALLGMSVPLFWLALLMQLEFGTRLHLLPAAGNASPGGYIMPVICLATFPIAFIARITRSSLLEVHSQDYIRTARAKGVSEWRILYSHTIPNALSPIATVIGLRLGGMFAAAIVVEDIFAWPGIGYLTLRAIQQRDLPVVEGVLIVYVAIFVLINLLVDLSHMLTNPKLRGAHLAQT
jgi:ABC-type dipeptide/oligopeptide/nickel transport system permease component